MSTHNADSVRCRLYGGKPPCPDADSSCLTECEGLVCLAGDFPHSHRYGPDGCLYDAQNDGSGANRLIEKVQQEAAQRGCCGDDAWRGRLCPYHQGVVDGIERAAHIDGSGAER